MSNSVVARMQGDEYQSLYFWLMACRLFQEHTRVYSVGYEYDIAKSFDDVVVSYDPPSTDELGDQVHIDFFQIKFHVAQEGTITWQSLCDPAFINATSVSFLQRLTNAYQLMKQQGKKCRFHLVTPWIIDPKDPLCILFSNTGGGLRLKKLMEGKTAASKMGKIRKAWREHMGLANDEELQEVLSSLRLIPGSGTMVQLIERLNDRLIAVGLHPIKEASNTHTYVSLIQNLFKKGKVSFQKQELLEYCKAEGLWRGVAASTYSALEVGIRSFFRWAENMEDETENMLQLENYFDGRYLKEDYCWQDDIPSEIEGFIKKTFVPTKQYNLQLDVHASIAFAAGYFLDVKSGIDVAPVQKVPRGGKQIWRPDDHKPLQEFLDWEYCETILDDSKNDVAFAIGVRHDIVEDVMVYIKEANLHIGRVVSCTIDKTGPSAFAIQDANHASYLADRISVKVRARSADERRGHLHIFYAGPNALLFFIGQLARSFGQCTIYEYDFDKQLPGAYEPSITFPL